MNGDWDRHWNTLCLGIITLATATVGAAFFAGDIVGIEFSPNDIRTNVLQVVKIVCYIFILLVLVRMVIAGSESIFTPDADLAREGKSKRIQTAYVFEGFILIVVAIAGLLLANLFIDMAAAVAAIN